HYSPLLFFITDTSTTQIYILSLHDALPISCMEVNKRITSLGSERGSDAGKRDARRADTMPDWRHCPTRQRLGVQLPGPTRPQGETPWAYSTGIRGATASEPEKLLALRARQSSRKHAARRTEVPPSKTSDCEGDW